jgi:hypothetical protein
MKVSSIRPATKPYAQPKRKIARAARVQEDVALKV